MVSPSVFKDAAEGRYTRKKDPIQYRMIFFIKTYKFNESNLLCNV